MGLKGIELPLFTNCREGGFSETPLQLYERSLRCHLRCGIGTNDQQYHA